MKKNKIILVVLILSMTTLIFSGCGGGNPIIPPIEDEEQEYVVEEKTFNVDAEQGGTFSLSDGTELKIDPGALSDDAYVILKKVRYDELDFSKTWWADENPFVWIVDIIDCDSILGNVDLYMTSSQLEYIGGEISGGIVKLKDGVFELVKEFTATVGEKVLVSIENIGMTAYLFVTNPINDVKIMNDLVGDIGLAVQYYTNGNCTSLYNLYQQALQEESTAGNDLINYPGVNEEDAQEIFDKVFNLKTVIDFAIGLIPKSGKEIVVGTAIFSYKIYSAIVGIGEICKYTNAYMIAKNKTDIYSSKVFKLRVIKYLYEQDCIGNDDGEECIPSLISPSNGAVLDNGCSDQSDLETWYFDWSDCPGVTYYHLYVMGPHPATIPLVDNDYITSSSYTFNGYGYIADKNRFNWTWKVRAMVNGQWGPWTEEGTFNVEPLNTDCDF